jgi:hypothetical protein
MADWFIRTPSLISCVAATKTKVFTIRTNLAREVVLYRVRLVPQSVTVGDLPTRILIEEYSVDGSTNSAVTPVAVDSANASATPGFDVQSQTVAPTTLVRTPYEFYMWPQGQGDDNTQHPQKLTPLAKLKPATFNWVTLTAGAGAVTHNAWLELLVAD